MRPLRPPPPPRSRFLGPDGTHFVVRAFEGVVSVEGEAGDECHAALDEVFRAIAKVDVVTTLAPVAEGRLLSRRSPVGGARWVLDPAPPGRPGTYAAWSPDDPEVIHRGGAADLHARVDAALSVLLGPYEGQVDVPAWVAEARQVHTALLAFGSPRPRLA